MVGQLYKYKIILIKSIFLKADKTKVATFSLEKSYIFNLWFQRKHSARGGVQSVQVQLLVSINFFSSSKNKNMNSDESFGATFSVHQFSNFATLLQQNIN